VSCEHDLAIVCAVGDGLRHEPGLAGEVLLGIGDVPLRMLSQAASRRNVTFVIREAELPAALRRLHDRFFAPAALAAAGNAAVR